MKLVVIITLMSFILASLIVLIFLYVFYSTTPATTTQTLSFYEGLDSVGSMEITDAWQVLPLHTVQFINEEIFNQNSVGKVTVLKAGMYEVSFGVQFQTGPNNVGGKTGTCESQLFKNENIPVLGTTSGCSLLKQAPTLVACNVTNTVVMNLEKNDSLSVGFRRSVGTVSGLTVANQSFLLIQLL